MESLPAILAIGTANPLQRYSQERIYEVLAQHAPSYRSDRIRQIFMNSDIDYRHLYVDFDSFTLGESSDQLHERYQRGAMDIGSQAVLRCLEHGKIDVSDIDCIIAVSCTGYLCPGLSSLLIKHLGMRTNIQRADLLGMGCAGAMPGLQRAFDFVKAYPDRKALLLTVEICSACYYVDDSLDTVVGNAICADGAAAVVVGMSNDPTVPKIVGFETYLEPAYLHTVGFEQHDGKLRIVLSKDIRTVAGTLAKILIQNLLTSYSTTQEHIAHWILHSGGRRVIDNIQMEMQLSDAQVRHSKCVLKKFGNMSAPTVLFVLQETLLQSNPTVGEIGVMVAMGPGLAIEGALLRW